MLLQNPTQGVHDHFYSNGKRHTRILIAPKPSSTAQFTSNFSENCTYRQSVCSAYSSSDIPLTKHIRHSALLFNDGQDEQFLTCYHQQRAIEARPSSATQTTAVMLLEPVVNSEQDNPTLLTFVENLKKQQQQPDQTALLLDSAMNRSTLRRKIKPYGLIDMTPNL